MAPPDAMDALRVIIAHSARVARAPPPPSSSLLPPQPHSARVFDALALLAHLARDAPALRAAVREHAPRLAAAGALARAKRDALCVVRAQLAAPEHGVIGVLGLRQAHERDGADRFSAAFDSHAQNVLGPTLSALEAADLPPAVTVASGDAIDEAFTNTLRRLGLQIFDTEADSCAALQLALQWHSTFASAPSPTDGDADAEPQEAIAPGRSMLHDIICAGARAGLLTERKYTELMAGYDFVADSLSAVDADMEACVPQLAPDDAAAWRAFEAYVTRCFACEPLARARALCDSADANAALVALHLGNMSMQQPSGRIFFLPAADPTDEFTQSMMRLLRGSLYQKDVDQILRGAFPVTARNADAVSLAFFDRHERTAAIVEQQDGE
jgi:hypothetical protein